MYYLYFLSDNGNYIDFDYLNINNTYAFNKAIEGENRDLYNKELRVYSILSKHGNYRKIIRYLQLEKDKFAKNLFENEPNLADKLDDINIAKDIEELLCKNINVEFYKEIMKNLFLHYDIKPFFIKLAEKGNLHAQKELGIIYGDVDDEKSFFWWKKAALQNDAEAQCALGFCYMTGIGVTQDKNKAIYWYKRSANQGDAKAQYNLAANYYDGNGVDIDYDKSLYWYEKAAEQNYEDAKEKITKLFKKKNNNEVNNLKDNKNYVNSQKDNKELYTIKIVKKKEKKESFFKRNKFKLRIIVHIIVFVLNILGYISCLCSLCGVSSFTKYINIITIILFNSSPYWNPIFFEIFYVILLFANFFLFIPLVEENIDDSIWIKIVYRMIHSILIIVVIGTLSAYIMLKSNTTKYIDGKDSILVLKEEDNYFAVESIYLCTYDATIKIPATHRGKPIEQVLANATKKDYSIEKIILPKSIKSIQENSFNNSFNHTSMLYYEGTINDWCNIEIREEVLHYPASYSNHFYMKNQNNKWEEVTHIEVPQGIEEIGMYQFYGFNNITSIFIPESVTSVGEYAFCQCENLKSIYYNGSVEDWNKIDLRGYYSNPRNYASLYVRNSNEEWEKV